MRIDYISAVRPLCRAAANAKETDLQTIIFMNRNTLCIRFFYMNCTISVNTTTIAAEIPKMGGGIAMKATGIVRRIDDLGRVVIPKEIRRTLRIREGDPLEIYTDRDGEVIFKKYSPMGEMSAVSAELAEALARTAGMSCAICDRDAVIAAAGGVKKDILERSISSELEQLMGTPRMLRTRCGRAAGGAYLLAGRLRGGCGGADHCRRRCQRLCRVCQRKRGRKGG